MLVMEISILLVSSVVSNLSVTVFANFVISTILRLQNIATEASTLPLLVRSC